MNNYMKEAERLVSELIDAAHGTVLNEDQSREDEALAALLAHIPRGAVLEGWKEATIAWEICASIHREYAKKKDPFFTTRQSDFMKHAESARAKAFAPAPDMAEVERLVREYGNSCRSDAVDVIATGDDPESCEVAHTALLAHIQRGAVPEGWQVVPKEPTTEMCRAGLAERHDDLAKSIYAAMLAAAPAPAHFRDAAPVTAEVPMPEPVAYGFGNTAITGHTNRLMMVRIDIPGGDQYAGAFWLPLVLADEACTYGDAREAAGYAAGVAAVRDCRTCRNYTRDGCIQTAQCVDGDGYSRAIPVRFWSTVLRGEVKP